MKTKTKIIGLCAVAVVLIGVVLACVFVLKPKKEFSVLDQSGEAIATFEKWYTLEEPKMVYCDVVITEATEILAEKYKCSTSYGYNEYRREWRI